MRGQLKVVTPVSVVKCLPLPRRRSLARLHRELGLRGPVVCTVNGRPILRRKRPRYSGWSRVPRRTDVVEFIILPQGGDRQGNKDIIRTVALLALVIAAPYAVGPAAGFGLGLTGLAATGASAAIVIGGSFLLNVLLPPGSGAAAEPAKTESASPTYNIDAQGNIARLNQPIPKQFGYHQMVPDFGARPWVRYYGNDQYLHTFLCCGLDGNQVHKIRMDRVDLFDETIGDPRILDGVEVQICQPGEPVTLFDTAMWTSPDVSNLEMRRMAASGASLNFTNNTVGPGGGGGGSPVGVNGFNVFRAGDEVTITGAGANDGTRFVQSVNLEAQRLTMSGGNFPSQGDVSGVTIALSDTAVALGPYPCCPPGEVINLVEVDVVFPRGLGAYDENGNIGYLTNGIMLSFYLRTIDDFGNPLTSFALAFQKTFNGKTTTPIRETLSGAIGPQRCEIVGIRETNNSSDPKALHDSLWTGLRGRMPHDNIYPDTTMVAIKMRASGQLSAQSSRMINVIQTAKVPVWNGSTWSAPVANRSPAWAAAYIARTPIIGAGLPDSRLDKEGLLALDATWAARDDYFDGIFDRSFNVWDAIKAVTRVGRAQPVNVGGTLSVVRDEPGGFARGVFTPQNIRRGTFKTTHILYDDSTPDDAIVSYMDETSWRNSDVRAMLPGSTSQAPANKTAFGIINRTKAWQFGMYEAASNLYRRKLCSFNTDMEGKLILKSQPVLVGHDVPKWGSNGRLIDFDRPTRKLTFDEPIDWSYGGQYYVSLSQPNNQEWGPVMVTQGVDPDIAIMDATDFAAVEVAMGTIPFIDFDTAGGEQIRFVAGPSTKYAQRMKLVSSNPQAIDNVELNLVIDDARVFDYENALPLPSGLPDPDTLANDFSIEGIANGILFSRSTLVGEGELDFISQGTLTSSSTLVGVGET